jgi:hypothetical protein
MSSFAYFLTVLLVGGLLGVCAYLGDRIIKLERRCQYYRRKIDDAEHRVTKLTEKVRHLEAF